MLENILIGLLTTLPTVLSAEEDDEWVDYTDMLRYDSVSQSMRGGDDPCAKCYKGFGLWAPIVMMLKHASTDDLLKIVLTLLLGVLIILILQWLSRCFTQRIWAIRRRGDKMATPVTDAATQTPELWGEQGGDVSHQQIPQEPEEIEGTGESPSDVEGDFSTQRELPVQRASIDRERPNLPAGAHDTGCLLREEDDGGTDSDSEGCCSARVSVPETRANMANSRTNHPKIYVLSDGLS